MITAVLSDPNLPSVSNVSSIEVIDSHYYIGYLTKKGINCVFPELNNLPDLLNISLMEVRDLGNI
jgi:hypothetical protein